MCTKLVAIGTVFLTAVCAHADTAPPAPAEQPLLLPSYATPVETPIPPVASPIEYGAPLPSPPVLVGESPWCESPYRNSAWRIALDIMPTVSHVSEQAFGDWNDNGGLALRLTLGYEGYDGFGTRLLFWGFGQDADTPAGDVELGASTFYWDFYKRFFVQEAELTLGGGLAGAHLQYDVTAFNDDADLSAGGITMFGEGFYPLWQFKKTDIGSIGRARLALVSGRWRDDGTPFVNDTDQDVATIVELAWGLEFRRRFGQHQDKYWYFDIVPEFQRWESSSLPSAFDPSFEGTNFSFGLAW